MSSADIEREDTAVQSMRDQGIADACAGREPKFWLDGDTLLERTEFGEAIVPWAELVGWDLPAEPWLPYRSAFAYARAYASEKGAE